MNCFYHTDVKAVGICKACNKGICADCCTDLDHGLACKNKHEEMVETYNSIIQGNAKVYKNAGTNTVIAPVFYLFMGIVFAVYGFTSKTGIKGLPFILGVGFIIFAIVVFIRNRATFNANET